MDIKYKRRVLAFTILCLSSCSIILFLYGFFPLKLNKTVIDENELPKEIKVEDKHLIRFTESVLSESVHKIVLVVVDGLRYDFVGGQDSNMKYLAELRDKGVACLHRCTVNPPTVTMPRIKALVTGKLSSFVDIALNLGSVNVYEDNFLLRSRIRGKKIVFYGDDTWIRIFPDVFHKSEGVTSFYVSDFTQSSESNKTYILIMTGDHGMKNSGGHGGSTFEEVTVPFVTVGTPCGGESNIVQTDVAVSLSALWSLPIPAESIGNLIPEVISLMPEERQLYWKYYNTQHLIGNIEESLPSYSDWLRRFNIAKNYHCDWINKRRPPDLYDNAKMLYDGISNEISKTLSKPGAEFDYFMTGLAIMVLAKVVISSLCIDSFVIRVNKFSIVGYIVFWVILYLCLQITYSYFFISFYLVTFIIIWRFRFKIGFTGVCERPDTVILFLLFGTVCQILSMASTSFIEEEHQIWYYLWPTVVMFIIMKNTKEYYLKLFCVVIAHRLLRKLNQTGDQWSNEPDIADWFQDEQNRSYFIVYTFLSLIFSLVGCHRILKVKNDNRNVICDLLFCSGSVFMIFMYKAIPQELVITLPQPRLIIWKACIFSTFLVWLKFFIFYYCMELRSRWNMLSKLDKKIGIIKLILILWIQWSSILLRAHNILLPSVLLFFSFTISDALRAPWLRCKIIFVHHWLAYVFFFYQGNSNSLSSIDVTSGYIGQNEYRPILAGVMVFCGTYSLPILSYLLMMLQLLLISRNGVNNEVKMPPWKILFVTSSLRMIVYLIIMIASKNHLFIWSVFSPKLIYVVFSTFLEYFIAFSCQILF